MYVQIKGTISIHIKQYRKKKLANWGFFSSRIGYSDFVVTKGTNLNMATVPPGR